VSLYSDVLFCIVEKRKQIDTHMYVQMHFGNFQYVGIGIACK